VSPAEALRGEEVVVEASRLRVGYGRGEVLADVDFLIRRGQFWFFVGPNGEGKTTLVKSILGILRPLAGRLELSPGLTDGRAIGFVPQRCDMKRTLPMTVRDFVLMGLVRKGISRREAARDLEWALGTVGLEGMAARDYWSLSGGQRQRTLIARGLIRRPMLLLLDEPTNGLDLAAEDALLRLVARLNREEGITVILVTHAISIAARHASHVALFHDHRVTAGPREEVLTSSNLKRAYGINVEIPPHRGMDAEAGIAAPARLP
jgi:ABC-type Mn2+/Zn2+ transport system ATPase subunit